MTNEKSNSYDLAIIGAGVIGSAIARCLASYNLDIVLLEKEADVGFGVSKANSGIIHAGFHHSVDSLKAKMEIQGNLMYERLHHELGFPFKRVGIIVAAFSEEELAVVEQLYRQGLKNGVPNLEVCNKKQILSLEPKLNADVIGGLYAPTGGVVEPYRLVFAFVENAINNGVTLKTNFDVSSASFDCGKYQIASRTGEKISARYVINSSGLFADNVSKIFNAENYEIQPRKGEEFLLERDAAGFPNHVVFPVPCGKSKGVLIIPTVEGTMMIGPTADEVDDKSDTYTSEQNLRHVFETASNAISEISRSQIITSFAGLRPALADGDFYIKESELQKNFIHVAGIQSPGLTAAPAIAEYVKDILKKAGLELTEKMSFNPKVSPVLTARNKTPEELDALIKNDPRYGNIICQCEKISEGEIIEAIRKGHTTLDGIKFYTRAGMGRCQGGFCTYRILKIIARETGCSIEEITKRGADSNIIKKELSHV